MCADENIRNRESMQNRIGHGGDSQDRRTHQCSWILELIAMLLQEIHGSGFEFCLRTVPPARTKSPSDTSVSHVILCIRVGGVDQCMARTQHKTSNIPSAPYKPSQPEDLCNYSLRPLISPLNLRISGTRLHLLYPLVKGRARGPLQLPSLRLPPPR